MANQILENAKVGWQLGSTGFSFIQSHKKTVLFSFFSGCLYVLSIFFFILPAIGSTVFHLSVSKHWLLCFLFLFLTTIFSALMKVSLSIYTAALFEGNELSVLASIGLALSRFFAIVQWACIATIVGMVVGVLRNRNKNGSFTNTFTGLFGSAIQLGWNVFTFFVIPLLAFENLSIIATIQESASLLKKTWGPTAGATFNIGFIGLGWLLTWYLFFFGPFTLYCTYFLKKPLPTEKVLFLVITGLTAFFVPLLLITMVVTTVTTIIKTALFNYTKQKPTGPFGTQLLKISFSS